MIGVGKGSHVKVSSSIFCARIEVIFASVVFEFCQRILTVNGVSASGRL